MKRLKKLSFLGLAIAILVTPISSVCFADSSIFVSEEGIGMTVESPITQNLNIRMARASKDGYTPGKKRSVEGGTLWAHWKNNGSSFRAVYDHNKKEHRCSAQNDSNTGNGKYFKRSPWENPKVTAYSPWIPQTLWGNKVFALTR